MLDGFRVLDLTDERGFLAGKILADMGADVIKLEPPGGDSERRFGPFVGDVEEPERSLPWLALNTSKRGVTLELGSQAGRELFRKLVGTADVVLESFTPGSMEALGIGWPSMADAFPRLVWCAITPFGQYGPRATYRAHDLVIVAMGGNAAVTGEPDLPPVRCSMPTSYYHAAPEAALGIVIALNARETSGRGDFVDVSMQECQLATLMSGPGQYPLTGRNGHRAGARIGRTREIWRAADGWISFGLRGGPTRVPNLVALCAYMAESHRLPDWLADYDWESFNHNTVADDEIERLEAVFGAFFATKTRRELYEESLERRILLAPCNDAREILEHPQLRDRELFVTLEYPELGASIEHPAFFAKSSCGGIRVRRRAPRIGEHNAEVYADVGIDARGLSKLVDAGVV